MEKLDRTRELLLSPEMSSGICQSRQKGAAYFQFCFYPSRSSEQEMHRPGFSNLTVYYHEWGAFLKKSQYPGYTLAIHTISGGGTQQQAFRKLSR